MTLRLSRNHPILLKDKQNKITKMPPKGANLLEYSEQGRDILSKFSSAPLEGFATHSVDVSISEFMKDSNTTVEKGRDYLLWHLINVEEVLQDIAENAIIDGGYDEGIDAYLVDSDEKRIRLFQSKYGSAHAIGAIDQFVQDVARLKEKEQSKLKRDELQYLWKILNDKKMKVDLVYITDQCVDDYKNDKVRVMGRQQVYQTLWERIKKPAKGQNTSLRILKQPLEHKNCKVCVVSAFDLAELVDTSHDWIYERTGIVQRHIASENESSVDMAYNASLKALSMAELKPNDIDMIIVATATPERKFPSTAVLLQNSLKIDDAFAFDINAACTGFVYALDVAEKYLKTKIAKNILVVGTEKMSSLLNWKDRNTCVLFGDGAGAIVLSQSNKPGILSTTIGSNGTYKDLLTVNIDSEFIEMQGNDVFKIAVKTMGKLAISTLEKNNISITKIDWLIPHQANSRIINAIAKKISLPVGKVILTVDKHGNTSAASIPLALDDAYQKGSLKSGDLIMLEAFGAGFTWVSALLKF